MDSCADKAIIASLTERDIKGNSHRVGLLAFTSLTITGLNDLEVDLSEERASSTTDGEA